MPLGVAIAVHGGAGGSTHDQDGCEQAALRGMEALIHGESATAATIRAVRSLEDDGRFNAGFGSVLCLDGSSVEMDAAVMDSAGILGAVTCLKLIRNPILAARAVADTPHWLLAGEGAERFALKKGLALRNGSSIHALKKHRQLITALGPSTASRDFGPFEKDWNYAMPWQAAINSFGSGTVGAVAIDAQGCFAVATSTGGCAPSLLGRVGDTPIVGCGFFAGEHGAIAVTGVGEHIARLVMAKSVYDSAIQHDSMAWAVHQAVHSFPPEIDLGIIAVSRREIVMKSNRNMPCVVMRK